MGTSVPSSQNRDMNYITGLLGRVNEIVFVIMPNIYIIACTINAQSVVTPGRLDVL